MNNTIKIKNRKASFEYFLVERLVAGIQLQGTEIKSIREGKANLTDSYCAFEDGELFVKSLHITEYSHGTFNNHMPKRVRKLLLTKKELKVAEKTASISSKSIRISFNTGSSELSENAKEILRIKIGDTLRTFADMRVRLTGHTDNTGSKTVNKALSKKRADAVSKFLAEEYGYDVARFIVIGAGPDNPIADNKTDAGRAKNRRTEIELIKS